jgi:acetyltransferase-like isoleucine patch superfamily enzyme
MKSYQKVQDYYSEKGLLALYQKYVIGESSLWNLLKYELLINFMSGLPGALGLASRKFFYPMMIPDCGKGIVWGKNMVIRYPQKIRIQDQCIFDDGCVLDAKGESNKGISIGKFCMLGRHTILGCKNSDIIIGDHVGISPHSIIHAVDTSGVTVEENVVIGPMVYLAGGGNYHFERTDIPISEQGMDFKGGIRIGKNCWLGANTVVLDGITIGHDTIIGAGSVVSKDLPPFAIALGNPAKIIKIRGEE